MDRSLAANGIGRGLDSASPAGRMNATPTFLRSGRMNLTPTLHFAFIRHPSSAFNRWWCYLPFSLFHFP
jgi:hypothetical protein